MACHEIAALRLGLHGLIGDRPEHERRHELAELADRLDGDGPLAALARAANLAEAQHALDAAAVELEQRVAGLAEDDPSLGYHRALVVQVRAAQRALARIREDLAAFYRDLDDIHDLLHEVFPGSA